MVHGLPDRAYHAADLVPEHLWRPVQTDAAVQQVQVGRAHAAGNDVDQDVERPERGDWALLEAQVARAVPDSGEGGRGKSGTGLFELHHDDRIPPLHWVAAV